MGSSRDMIDTAQMTTGMKRRGRRRETGTPQSALEQLPATLPVREDQALPGKGNNAEIVVPRFDGAPFAPHPPSAGCPVECIVRVGGGSQEERTSAKIELRNIAFWRRLRAVGASPVLLYSSIHEAVKFKVNSD